MVFHSGRTPEDYEPNKITIGNQIGKGNVAFRYEVPTCMHLRVTERVVTMKHQMDSSLSFFIGTSSTSTMSVIIRLQNLPWSANALDIRNYFRGLSIPEGGVHIVGGELGDAFIAFR